MNEFEASARGQRAQQASEFIGPILDDIRASYMVRIADIAVKELNPAKRTEAITALSIALRILNNVDTGLAAIIRDGQMAENNILKVETVEKMGAHKRRLFDIAPQR